MARLVARAENSANRKTENALSKLVLTLEKKYKTPQAIKLANIVQNSIIDSLGDQYNVDGRGVFGAPFYVLLNTAMPSILVECGFINNPVEAKLLNTDQYQEKIAEGIVKGIERFLNAVPRTY